MSQAWNTYFKLWRQFNKREQPSQFETDLAEQHAKWKLLTTEERAAEGEKMRTAVAQREAQRKERAQAARAKFGAFFAAAPPAAKAAAVGDGQLAAKRPADGDVGQPAAKLCATWKYEDASGRVSARICDEADMWDDYADIVEYLESSNTKIQQQLRLRRIHREMLVAV
eukprot:gene812-1152_t